MKTLTKKLKDITLGELRSLCVAHPRCDGCPLYDHKEINAYCDSYLDGKDFDGSREFTIEVDE